MELSKLKEYHFSMRKLALALMVTGALWGCSDDPNPVLPSGLITELRAYDLDNNANASDLRVDFHVLTNQNVEEYRVMVMPSEDTLAFDASIAAQISDDSYQGVIPNENFELDFSIHRLDADLLDVNGFGIANGLVYTVVVLIVAEDVSQLSHFSRPFLVDELDVLSGEYIVNDASVDSARIRSQALGRYSGNLYGSSEPADYCDGSTLLDVGRFTFEVEGQTITNFVWEYRYWTGNGGHTVNPTCWVTTSSTQGSGEVDDELSFHINLTSGASRYLRFDRR